MKFCCPGDESHVQRVQAKEVNKRQLSCHMAEWTKAQYNEYREVRGLRR